MGNKLTAIINHCIINLKLEERNHNNKPKDYWKINSQLLKNTDFCEGIKMLILDMKNDHKVETPTQKREYLKFSIGKYSIMFGKKKDYMRKRERKICD